MAVNDNHFDPKRTFKAAVHAVGLVASFSPTEEERKVGEKFRRTTPSDDERAAARRKLRAAVYTVLATNQLNKRPTVPEMYIHYESDYEEPVYEWEDVSVPESAGRSQFRREVSLEVEDIFADEEDYLRKIARLKYDRLWKRKIGQKVMAKNKFQAVVLAVMQAQRLNHALAVNMHPRNQYRGLEYVLAAAPKVISEVKSRELYHQLHFELTMRHRLRAAVFAVLAVERLKKLRAVRLESRRKLRAAVYAVLAVDRLNKLCAARVEPRRKLRAAVYAVLAMERLNKLCVARAEPRRKLRAAACAVLAVEQLKIRASRAEARRKLRAAVYAVLAVNKLKELPRAKAKLRAKAVALEWENLAKCHRHAILYRQVRRRLDWLGTHIPPRHPHHAPYEYRKSNKDHPAMMATALEREQRPSSMAKLAWAVDTVVKASE